MSTPRVFVGVDRPNIEALAAFGADPDRGPVVMVNLLKFRPDGGAQRYAQYGVAVAPLLERVGGRLIHVGGVHEALVGSGDWDMVALAEYPSHHAFVRMILSEEYEEIAHLRNESLERSELHPTYPDDLPTPD
jgi:uncharacterized protein (DUF1330 family)